MQFLFAHDCKYERDDLFVAQIHQRGGEHSLQQFGLEALVQSNSAVLLNYGSQDFDHAFVLYVVTSILQKNMKFYITVAF